MRIFAILGLVITFLAPVPGWAKSPVVVELFTSQGCSSCPPADEFVRELALEDAAVIVLGWHVDYWDYMGWKDVFSLPEATARQEGYRRRWGLRALFTPQIVIQGETQTVGSNAPEVRMYVKDFEAETPVVSFQTTVAGGLASIRIAPLTENLPEADILIVRIIPEAETSIKAGENAGREHADVNIVRDSTRLTSWDAKTPMVVDGVKLGEGGFVLIVQAKNFGPILGAQYLE